MKNRSSNNLYLFLLVPALLVASTEAFLVTQTKQFNPIPKNAFKRRRTTLSSPPNTIISTTSKTTTSTRLYVLLELPDGFFTITFPMLGILLGWSRGFGRLRMEERAWEMRVEESRIKRLREDPTLTEIELRRKEASMEWSAYGKPRMDEERAERERQQRERELAAEEDNGRSSNRRRGVRVLDLEDEEEEEDDYDGGSSGRRRSSPSSYRMTDEEINMFEAEYGIDYDPYYDDPYEEEELPDDINFQIDKKYGDRIYENGEVFYKDKTTGMFYRQGAKPRNLSFW